MRLVIQRVLQAEVQVNENTVGKINKGLLVFVGAGHEDSREVADKYLKKALNDYLYKTAKEYNCDIDGFGKYAVKYFTTIQDWQAYNWLDNFQNSTFNVNVETTIKSGNTFL